MAAKPKNQAPKRLTTKSVNDKQQMAYHKPHVRHQFPNHLYFAQLAFIFRFEVYKICSRYRWFGCLRLVKTWISAKLKSQNRPPNKKKSEQQQLFGEWNKRRIGSIIERLFSWFRFQYANPPYTKCYFAAGFRIRSNFFFCSLLLDVSIYSVWIIHSCYRMLRRKKYPKYFW